MTLTDAAKAYQAAVKAQCIRACSPPGDDVECNWPDCNCDPLAQLVILALEEQYAESGDCVVCERQCGCEPSLEVD